jgi:hypothetical protein
MDIKRSFVIKSTLVKNRNLRERHHKSQGSLKQMNF